MAKKFVWCVTTPAQYKCFDLLPTDRSDAVALCFQEPVDGYLFAPGTTWAAGRNLMYEHVRNGDYEYIIYIDDDAIFQGTSQLAGLRRFEELLDEFNPLIAAPRYSWHLNGNWDRNLRVQGLIASSACLHALRRDCWWALLPLWTEFDALSWWNAEHIIGRVAAFLWHGCNVQFNELAIENTCNNRGAYPKQDRCRSADAMVLEMLRPEWRHLVWPHNTPESFNSPPPVLRDSYALTLREIGRYVDLNHRYWRLRRP